MENAKSGEPMGPSSPVAQNSLGAGAPSVVVGAHVRVRSGTWAGETGQITGLIETHPLVRVRFDRYPAVEAVFPLPMLEVIL